MAKHLKTGDAACLATLELQGTTRASELLSLGWQLQKKKSQEKPGTAWEHPLSNVQRLENLGIKDSVWKCAQRNTKNLAGGLTYLVSFPLPSQGSQNCVRAWGYILHPPAGDPRGWHKSRVLSGTEQ